jgi:6-phosphogluconolactonase
MGLDRIMVYDLEPDSGRLVPSPHPFVQLSSGAVSAFSYEAATSAMRIVNTVSTCPPDFEGHNSGAQIVVHPSGRFLYSSNRGHNSIAMFTIDPDSGRHRLIGLESSQGQTPRNFNVDPAGSTGGHIW